MSTLPWLVPFVAVGVLASALAGGTLGRWLAMPWWSAFVLLSGLVLVVAVTLTPVRAAAPGAVDPFAGVPAAVAGEPLLRWPWQWWPVDDRTLNVLLFVPVGIGVALVGRRILRRWLVAAALLLPLAVEGLQFTVGWLARDAQWQDVVDNTIGVALGLGVGLVLRRWVSVDRHPR